MVAVAFKATTEVVQEACADSLMESFLALITTSTTTCLREEEANQEPEQLTSLPSQDCNAATTTTESREIVRETARLALGFKLPTEATTKVVAGEKKSTLGRTEDSEEATLKEQTWAKEFLL